MSLVIDELFNLKKMQFSKHMHIKYKIHSYAYICTWLIKIGMG